MKPKVLYTAFDLVPSPKGASTHITYFVRGLVQAGYDLTLITAGDPALPERDTYHGATLLRAPSGAELNFLKRALAFGDYAHAYVAANGPQAVVHVRSIWGGFPLAEIKQRFGYKLLYEVNGLPSIEMKYHYPALKEAPVLDKIREWEAVTLHLADAIICPSHVTAAYLASMNISPQKITVIPNGIDPALFRPASPEVSGATETSRPATILYVGTLADWQGLAVLVEALPFVLARRAVRLRIVGRGRKRQRKLLQKRVRKLGLDDDVSFEPAVPYRQIPAVIAQAEVCVSPLGYNDRNVTQGCCPLKILEYMACGRPVVASNLPVVRELVGEGTEGLLFTPDDPQDLAEKILTILEDPALAAALGGRAAGRARRQFTWQVAQDRLQQVYQGLLNGTTDAGKAQGF